MQTPERIELTNFHYDLRRDFHGWELEKVLIELDELIIANPSRSIMVVHGRGDGVLRRGIRRFLKNHRHVEQVLAGEEENIIGADGVTVVYVR